MEETSPRVVLGTLWAEAYPHVADALRNTCDVHVFDMFNAEKSIEMLTGSVVNVLVMFIDMLDTLGPLLADLETAGLRFQHIIVVDETNGFYDAGHHAELGVCGSFPGTSDPGEVSTYIRHVLDTCPCEPGQSRLVQKIKARGEAMRRIEDDELDLAIVTLVAEGYSNEEIADKVHYSHQTIRNRLSEVLKSTKMTNRTELAVAWRRHLVERRLRHTRR